MQSLKMGLLTSFIAAFAASCTMWSNEFPFPNKQEPDSRNAAGALNEDGAANREEEIFQLPQMRAAWIVYSDSITQITKAIQLAGMNAFIVSYYLPNISTQSERLAAFFASEKKIHIAKFSFISTVVEPPDDGHALYFNGTELVDSALAPPLGRSNWQTITEQVEAVAKKAAADPAYRIDGLLIDFELYDHYDETYTYYTLESSYDSETFDEFVERASLSDLAPPTSYQRRFERRAWLQANGRLSDYQKFVASKAEQVTREMAQAIYLVNPHFLLGSYPSPNWNQTRFRYIWSLFFEFFKGWGKVRPPILYATDMYLAGSAANIPSEATIDSEGIARFVRKDTHEEVPVYYLPGFLIRGRSPGTLASDILGLPSGIKGFWIFSFLPLFVDCLALPNSYHRIPTFCSDQILAEECCRNVWDLSDASWINDCCPGYDNSVSEYFTTLQMLASKER